MDTADRMDASDRRQLVYSLIDRAIAADEFQTPFDPDDISEFLAHIQLRIRLAHVTTFEPEGERNSQFMLRQVRDAAAACVLFLEEFDALSQERIMTTMAEKAFGLLPGSCPGARSYGTSNGSASAPDKGASPSPGCQPRPGELRRGRNQARGRRGSRPPSRRLRAAPGRLTGPPHEQTTQGRLFVPSYSGPKDMSVEERLDELHAMLVEIRGLIAKPPEPARSRYSVEEAAELLGKTPFTVREWCRLGRINAAKRPERRGGSALWTIAADEIERYRNEGLLPLDPHRNG
jgi:hypothetical protein